MIRVYPKRDAVCPHGMECLFVKDEYECLPEPPRTVEHPISTKGEEQP